MSLTTPIDGRIEMRIEDLTRTLKQALETTESSAGKEALVRGVVALLATESIREATTRLSDEMKAAADWHHANKAKETAS